MNMQNIVKGLVCLCLLVGGFGSVYAQSGFKPNQGSVKPLYTITGEHKEPTLLSVDGMPTVSNIMSRVGSGSSSYGTGASSHLMFSAWRGNLFSLGAEAPATNVVTAVAPPPVRRIDENYQPGDWVPVGDVPYWLFAVLLVGYGVWRKKRANV